MVAQLQLHNLVDLALCDPEIGVVNFHHLRTLLHCMLKLSNHADSLVDDHIPQVDIRNTGDINNNNVVIGGNTDNSLNSSISKLGDNTNGETNDSDEKQDESAEKVLNNGLVKTNEEWELKLKELLSNQNNLENRVTSLEGCLKGIDEFPPNQEILKKRTEVENIEDNRSPSEDVTIIKEDNRLGMIWQNKKTLKRIEAMEEAMDKLFTLMNDILNEKPTDSLQLIDIENLKNQLTTFQNQVDCFIENVDNCKQATENNKLLIDECLNKVNQFVEISEEKPKGETRENNDSDDYTNLAADIKRLEIMLREKADLSKLDEKANLIDLDSKANSTDLESKANLTDLDSKANLSDLDSKVNISDLDNKANLSDLDSKANISDLDNKANIADLDSKVNIADLEAVLNEINQIKVEMNKMNEWTLMFSNNINSERNNTDPESPMSSVDNESILAIQVKLGNMLLQIDENKKKQIEAISQIDGLNKTDEKLILMLEELKMMIPTVDASVVAAIQHLSQENRHQITALHTNLRILQESQLKIPIPVVSSSNDNSSNTNTEALQLLQNRLLSLQEEQIKQSSQVHNMIDDYKEEFNRKQLHIDALYEYIDKLQNNKANKVDVTEEMYVKADKQALDSKVNMSTFDERYQMLDQTLQQALARLDQYAERESSLQNEFLKLNEDMQTKMDTDAAKKLKRFLDARLKEIQESRSHENMGDVINMKNAAGMRKPMPLSYNCLSCDRPIDVKMRGVMPPIPSYFPMKKPLLPIGSRPENPTSTTRYDNMVVNRSCGGQHTSVNINMLRMIKLGANSSEPHLLLSRKSEEDMSDCVMGNDGQIYRGSTMQGYFDEGSSYQQSQARNEGKRLKTRSAKHLGRNVLKPKSEDRSRSAECMKNEDGDCKKTFSLPSMEHVNNVQTDTG